MRILGFGLSSFIIFLVLLTTCNTTEPPPDDRQLTLTFEDASCTEAWLSLTTANLQLPISITLKQNDQIKKIINLVKADTLLYVDSLLSNNSYTFQSIIQPFNQSGEVKSNELNVSTMDTTSHNFIFETFTFGKHSSSVLYDVAIINENNIWAVGEVYMNDSLGQPDPTPYNAIHWDGVSWKITRIPTKTFSGSTVSSEIRTIFAFNENDIWTFSIAGSYSHWNGSNWETEFVDERVGSGNKFWGTSSSNLFLVCTNGGITKYNGSTWQKIESGTDIRLTDIYGTVDGENLWVCGWDNNHTGGIILSIENLITEVIWDGISVNGEYLNFINTLWTSGGEFWLAGGFVFRQSVLFQDKGHLVRIPTETGSKLFDPGNFVLSIRGTEKNNIFLVGDLGMLWHFNGNSWHKYDELYSQQLDRRLNSVNAKDNLVVAVGWKNSSAWIALGTK